MSCDMTDCALGSYEWKLTETSVSFRWGTYFGDEGRSDCQDVRPEPDRDRLLDLGRELADEKYPAEPTPLDPCPEECRCVPTDDDPTTAAFEDYVSYTVETTTDSDSECSWRVTGTLHIKAVRQPGICVPDAEELGT